MSPDDFEGYEIQTAFSLCTKRLCVNITINEDTVLEKEELFYVSMSLGMYVTKSFIIFNGTLLPIVIVDDDKGTNECLLTLFL